MASGVEAMFLERLAKRMAGLEARRQKLAPVVLIACGATIAFTALGCFKLLAVAPRLVVAAGLVGMIATAGVFYMVTWRYVRDFKLEAIGRMVQHLSPGLEFHQQGFIRQDSFERSGLFPGEISEYKGED